MWYVYILKSEKKRWYYVGSTNRLKERVAEHNDGKVSSTKGFKPLTLVFTKQFPTEKGAREYERSEKKKKK
jgi:predicted GIY-YIG superfamily endonuclease